MADSCSVRDAAAVCGTDVDTKGQSPGDRLLWGLLLLAVLLRPLGNVDLSAVSLDLSAYRQTVERRQAELEQEGQKELLGLIEAELESYISDKAADMGLTLRVQVTVEPDGSGVPVPVSVELTGPRSEVLSRWLETELGVPAERQVWNEN